jgi:hypothetical protein
LNSRHHRSHTRNVWTMYLRLTKCWQKGQFLLLKDMQRTQNLLFYTRIIINISYTERQLFLSWFVSSFIYYYCKEGTVPTDVKLCNLFFDMLSTSAYEFILSIKGSIFGVIMCTSPMLR